MASVMQGKRATIKEKDFNKIQMSYPFVERERTYWVKFVQKLKGEKKRVYLEVPGQEQWLCLYAGTLKALPRCAVCNSEFHKTPGGSAPCPDDTAGLASASQTVELP